MPEEDCRCFLHTSRCPGGRRLLHSSRERCPPRHANLQRSPCSSHKDWLARRPIASPLSREVEVFQRPNRQRWERRLQARHLQIECICRGTSRGALCAPKVFSSLELKSRAVACGSKPRSTAL